MMDLRENYIAAAYFSRLRYFYDEIVALFKLQLVRSNNIITLLLYVPIQPFDLLLYADDDIIDSKHFKLK